MIDGYVDTVTRNGAAGWSADTAYPDEPVDVTIVVNGKGRGRIRADRARTDLRHLGTLGEGLHGFQFTFDPPLPGDEEHEVVVRDARSGNALRHGRVLIPMDEVLNDGVRTPPVAYAPEPGQEPRGDPSNLPRYVIHVGPHKTGSKYLQKAFSRLQGPLFEVGVYYPMRWADKETRSHLNLVRGLSTDAPDIAEEFAALGASAYQTVLLSAEDLVDLPVQALRRLRQLLDGPITVVFYCRRWSELVPSAWQEVVKQGSAAGLPEFLAQHLINPVGSTLVNYDQALGRLTEAFGLDSLRLVSYNNLVNSGTDLLRHFLETFVHWSEPNGTLHERENTSLDIRDVELIRVLNARAIARYGHSGFDVCARFLAMKHELDLELIYAAMDRDIHEIEVNEASAGLRAVHEAIFERYGSRLAHPRSGFNLFPLLATRVPFVAQNYLLEEQVLPRIAAVYQTVIKSS